MEALSGLEWELMKEVRNGEVQNKGYYHTRTTSHGVYIVISLINVASLMHTSHVIKACYGLMEGEEHLNKSMQVGLWPQRFSATFRQFPSCGSALLSLPVVNRDLFFLLFTYLTKLLILSTTWERCLKHSLIFLSSMGKKNPTHVQIWFWESVAYCIHVGAAVFHLSPSITEDSFQALLLMMH